MVDIDMPNVSSPLLEQLEALGPVLGVLLILGGIFLMIRGHERMQYIAVAVGAGLGYIMTPMVYSLIPDGTLDELYLMGILVALLAGIMLMTVQVTVSLSGSLIVYYTFSSAFKWLEGKGVEFASSEFVTNGMAVAAFFLVVYVRKKMPVFVSALLGSISTLSGMLVLSGRTLDTLSPRNTSSIVIVLILSTLSVFVQMRAIKRKYDAENPEEVGETRRRGELAEDDPRIYRAPSRYDLPDLR